MHHYTGFPSPAEEYRRPALSLDRLLIRFPARTLFARFAGDAMMFEGIADGDLLIIEKGESYSSGSIVLAFHEGERLVRKYEVRGSVRFLCPANPDFAEIEINETTEIVGSVMHRVTHYLRITQQVASAS